MELNTFQTTYTQTMVDLIKIMSDREVNRLANILQKGSHYQILEEKEAISQLATSRMIVNTFNEIK